MPSGSVGSRTVESAKTVSDILVAELQKDQVSIDITAVDYLCSVASSSV